MAFTAVFFQSRSHLLRRTSQKRFKPFDIFCERRRIICSKKLATKTNCTPAVRQEHCLSSRVPPCDHLAVNGCESLCSRVVSIESSCPSSEFVMNTTQSHQLTLGYNTCKSFGADKLESKLSFDKHSTLRTEFTEETLKEQTVDGGCVTYNRYVVLLMISCFLIFIV